MKVEVNEKKKDGRLPFPKLMISDAGNIVLMVNYGVGMIVSPGNKYSSTGMYSTDWAMDAFTDFHGTVTLSNE